MSYGKKLYKSNLTAFDAENVYDSTIGKLQNEINANKVSKDGDTMIGTLNISLSASDAEQGINIINPTNGTSELPQSSVFKGIFFKDKDDVDLVSFYSALTANGTVRASMRARNVVNNANVDNTLHLAVSASGARTVTVTDPAAWCNAINAVNKAGDTMSGNLEIDNTSPGEILKNTALDVTDSSYTQNNSTGFRLQDKNGKNVAIITDRYLANGATGLWMTGWKTVNGTNINNALSLYVDKNGNRIIGVSDPAPWRTALGLGEIINGTNTSGNVSIPSGTAKEFSSLTLSTGVWIVVACADWAANGAGYRQIATSDITNPNRSTATTTVGINGKEAYQQLTLIRTISGSSSNIIFYGLQNSGSTLAIYPYVYAVRIG